MSDEAMRQLEREAAAGDPAAKIRYARALERGGRRAEAARLLRTIIEREDARTELARYPAWHHGRADAGATCRIDAEPITSRPRVLWKTRSWAVPTEERDDPVLGASPLGVVRLSRDGIEVLDVETGARRWESSPAEWSAEGPSRGTFEVLADVLLVRAASGVWRHRLADGVDLGRVRVEARGGLLDAGRLFARLDRPARLVAYSVGPGASGEQIFAAELRGEPGDVAHAAGERVFLANPWSRTAVDRRTGSRVWTGRGSDDGFVADDRVFVALETDRPQRPDERELTFRNPDGEIVGRTEGALRPVALHAELVIAAAWDPTDPFGTSSLVAIDRGRREHSAVRELPIQSTFAAPVAIASDVLYTTTSEGFGGGSDWRLVACHVRGDLLWEVDGTREVERPTDSAPVPIALAALDRMVFVLLDDGTLIALTDLPEPTGSIPDRRERTTKTRRHEERP